MNLILTIVHKVLREKVLGVSKMLIQAKLNFNEFNFNYYSYYSLRSIFGPPFLKWRVRPAERVGASGGQGARAPLLPVTTSGRGGR